MYCRQCGTEIRPNAAFCARCGTPVARPGETAKKEAPAPHDRMSAEDMIRLANQYGDAGDYRQQLFILRDAQAKYPDVPGIYNLMGIAHRNLGDREEAIDCYRKAAELDPNNGTFLANTGVALLSAGKAEEALPWFEKGLPLMKRSNNASYPVSLGNYALALAESGYAENAVRCLKEAAQLGYANAETVRRRLEELGIYYH